ncbi:phosphatidylinositol mannoside acyltransferase [Propionibacteriaceae bacterium Y2011]
MSRDDLRDLVRDFTNRQLLAAGWRLGPRLPVGLQRRIVRLGSAVAVRHDGSHVTNLRHNLGVATAGPVSTALLRAAVASYLRNYLETLALPGWSTQDVVSRVRTRGEDRLRAAVATRGAVVALPHSANWDLAGAWACLTGMPVVSVAERLDDAEFAAFLDYRRQLGMEIHSHRDPGLIGTLVEAVRAGKVVCLMADRDLTRGAGVTVRWAGRDITVPAGPALVARLSGAALFPAGCHYTGQPGTGGMVITLAEEVTHRPGRDGLVAMCQEVTDHFAARIAQHPQDWHMLQPFFAADGPAKADR